MSLRAKLGLMFLGAVQVTFLTAVATFWAVQSMRLLTDDLSLIHKQDLRLQRVVDGIAHPAPAVPGAAATGQLSKDAVRSLTLLRRDAQGLREGKLVDRLTAPGSNVWAVAQHLKRHYANRVDRLSRHAGVVTRLAMGLFFVVVGVVLAGMMTYFAAIRVWLVRPIQALGRATRVISTGKLDHRIPVTSRDEFGTLAASINTMAGSLAENQRRLVAAERFAMVGEMAAYVAHNIRNPLASIRATAQTELYDLADDDPRRASFRDIVTATDRLESWVGDLLRFSSPVSLERTSESLNALVERCAELTRPYLARVGLDLRLALDPEVGPVALDRNKMEQVVTVLLSNAIDASPAGSTIRVVSAFHPGSNGDGFVSVRVEDAGKGIPPDRLGTLFTLFSTSKKSGTGLGLALAHKIVTAHDGTITVHSRENEGTVVEIRLPAG